ncbi:MAG: hypothetical protein ABIS29_02595, partial [Vicinamibacterales bacterium]
MSGFKGKVFLMALMGALIAAPASAATISVLAGAVIIDGSDLTTVGSGADPWLLSEHLGSQAILQFSTEGDETNPLVSNTTGSVHTYGKWLRKTVVNATSENWTSFELELQVTPGTPSLDGDGLSFAQGSGFEGSFLSDRFATYSAIQDIRDYLNFHDGVVAPGESVTFMFAMTDTVDRADFFLLQSPNLREVQAVPEPASLL